MSLVEYDSNNSGGSWWLGDDQWRALEAAGWIIEWAWLATTYDDDGNYVRDERGLPVLVHIETLPEDDFHRTFTDKTDDGYRYMGALAKRAWRVTESLRDAVAEWEEATGLDSTAAGCPCCGQPHNFTLSDAAGRHIASGPSTYYEARWD